MFLSSLLQKPSQSNNLITFLLLITVVLCYGDRFEDGSDSSDDSGRALRYEEPMVWSHYLENYVLSQHRQSRDFTHFDNTTSTSYSTEIPSTTVSSIEEVITTQTPDENLTLSPTIEALDKDNHLLDVLMGQAKQYSAYRENPSEMSMNHPHFQPISVTNRQQSPGILQQLFGLVSGSSVSSSGSASRPHSGQPPSRPFNGNEDELTNPNGFRAVSENELYLLGAMEKLVYRVDYLESRVRRSEQLIYYLMEGNKQQQERDPCPKNFTYIGENCYHINIAQMVNWKSANSACRALKANLAEFEKVAENEDIVAYLLNQAKLRGKDFWLGGLNPGLLWIWSNSAKPVNPKTNLTSIAMGVVDPSINAIDPNHFKEVESILQNTDEIKGLGRCLRLSYNSTKYAYSYYGQECTSRHHYICEKADKTLDNKIQKIARSLNLN